MSDYHYEDPDYDPYAIQPTVAEKRPLFNVTGMVLALFGVAGVVTYAIEGLFDFTYMPAVFLGGAILCFFTAHLRGENRDD